MAGGPAGAAGEGGIKGGSMSTAILLASFAAFGGILFGYDTGTIGGIIGMDDWLRTFGDYGSIVEGGPSVYYLKTSDKSLVVSIISVGTFFGALTAYPFGDFLGRKYGIMAACLVFCLGVGVQLDTHWGAFVAGRVIAGFGVGLVSCLVPMYQSECAPRSVRGFIVGLYQWAITIGLLIAACVNQGTKDRQNHSSWRIVIAIQFAWAAILAGGMFMLPESPRYLLLKGRDAEARKALSTLTRRPADSAEVDEECLDISMALEAERAMGKTTYMDCFRNNESRNGFRTWTGIWIQGWQQLTGVNFIFYYGTTFFKASGISNPFLITIATSVVNVGMTIPGILLIDRAGRRALLLYGAAIMVVCEFLVAIIGVTKGKVPDDLGDTQLINYSAQRTMIAFVCIYIAAFAATWGPIAWVVTGEIFPLGIRGKAMSMSVASNWLWNFGIGYATPYLVDKTTSGPAGIKTAELGVKIFFVWGSTCIGCLLFTYFFVPETKGLSLEMVDLLYRESTIIGSNKYRKEMLERGEDWVHRDGVAAGHGVVGDEKHLANGEKGNITHHDNTDPAGHVVDPIHHNAHNDTNLGQTNRTVV